jgi:hypothetical protein
MNRRLVVGVVVRPLNEFNELLPGMDGLDDRQIPGETQGAGLPSEVDVQPRDEGKWAAHAVRMA